MNDYKSLVKFDIEPNFEPEDIPSVKSFIAYLTSLVENVEHKEIEEKLRHEKWEEKRLERAEKKQVKTKEPKPKVPKEPKPKVPKEPKPKVPKVKKVAKSLNDLLLENMVEDELEEE